MILDEVQLEIKAIKEAFPALVELEVDSLAIVAVVLHEGVDRYFDLAELLEEGLPRQGVLCISPRIEYLLKILDLLHIFKFLRPLQQFLRQFQIHWQECMDEILKGDPLRPLVGCVFAAEESTANWIARDHLPWEQKQACIELEVADVLVQLLIERFLHF